MASTDSTDSLTNDVIIKTDRDIQNSMADIFLNQPKDNQTIATLEKIALWEMGGKHGKLITVDDYLTGRDPDSAISEQRKNKAQQYALAVAHANYEVAQSMVRSRIDAGDFLQGSNWEKDYEIAAAMLSHEPQTLEQEAQHLECGCHLWANSLGNNARIDQILNDPRTADDFLIADRIITEQIGTGKYYEQTKDLNPEELKQFWKDKAIELARDIANGTADPEILARAQQHRAEIKGLLEQGVSPHEIYNNQNEASFTKHMRDDTLFWDKHSHFMSTGHVIDPSLYEKYNGNLWVVDENGKPILDENGKPQLVYGEESILYKVDFNDPAQLEAFHAAYDQREGETKLEYVDRAILGDAAQRIYMAENGEIVPALGPANFLAEDKANSWSLAFSGVTNLANKVANYAGQCFGTNADNSTCYDEHGQLVQNKAEAPKSDAQENKDIKNPITDDVKAQADRAMAQVQNGDHIAAQNPNQIGVDAALKAQNSTQIG